MDLSPNRERVTALLKSIVTRLLSGDYESLESAQYEQVNSAEELQYGIEEYPGRLTMPPDWAFYEWDAIPVTVSNGPEWALVFDLWYDDEVSDNILEMSVFEVDGQLEFTIDNIHVM
ncbi:MAG: hypothetical protein U0176_20340 [Bacteroidia bacterium]